MVVTISTLLTALRNTIESPGAAPIEQQYIDFLTHPLAHPEVSVATSRVPDFALDSIQKPANGYRYLGLLAEVPVGFASPSATWDPSHDILAVHEVGQNTDSHNFAHVWEPCGVQLGTHFIIIFIHPSPAHSGHLSPMSYIGNFASRHSTPISAHTPLRAHTPVSTTPMVDFDQASDLLGFFQVDFHQTNSSSNLSDVAPPAPAATASLAQMLPNSLPAVEVLSAMDSSQNLSDIFTALGIDEKASIEPARFIDVNARQPNTLLVMVRNHRAMSQLLVHLGQPDHIDDPHGTHTTAYPQGLTMSTQNILFELGWTQLSYFHKSTWYGWAATAAAASWIDSEPGGLYILLVCILLLTIFYRHDSTAEGALRHLEGYQIFLGTRWSSRHWNHACCSFWKC
jgi:hypothetical protein